ncbi:hypothetical protein [Archangium violaceum]|uniref:Uncharacterized protein n=1 Tax=Archangium violaceum Cb vi76 TaxID=1406225 RepID=A0A084SIG6_9BACT|nr:hypothetical protein [Archangium violaceum]KFA88251.1 hypothetical protein Q664_42440 [Archangium violaceum Cb vi76]
MSIAKATSVQVDPSSPPAVSKRMILAAGQTQSRDSDYSCVVTNDTGNYYIVYLLHDNGWLAELWAQPPGQTVAIPPTWKLRIMTADGRDACSGTTGGDQTYSYCWSTTTQANSTFHFSTMSYG